MFNCIYNVYLVPKGEKREMIAKFANRTDAVNFAFDKSMRQYKDPNLSLLVLNSDGKKFMRYCEGVPV